MTPDELENAVMSLIDAHSMSMSRSEYGEAVENIISNLDSRLRALEEDDDE